LRKDDVGKVLTYLAEEARNDPKNPYSKPFLDILYERFGADLSVSSQAKQNAH
jgi:hypothetical protein